MLLIVWAQVRLAKERKKGDKIVSDSQERAFWRVYRPPPGCLSSLEVVPVPSRFRPGLPRPPSRKRTLTDLQREVSIDHRHRPSPAFEARVPFGSEPSDFDQPTLAPLAIFTRDFRPRLIEKCRENILTHLINLCNNTSIPTILRYSHSSTRGGGGETTR